jgi:hypothetical protein
VKKLSEYEQGISSAAQRLYEVLELRLDLIRQIDQRVYLFRFENGADIYLADFEELWDNVFSIRTIDWPNDGFQEHYLF